MAAAKKTKKAVKSSQAGEALKKLFFAGLGLAEETNQKLHQSFNALVKKGKAHEPEIKKAVDDVRKKAFARRAELEKKFMDLVRENDLVKSKEFQALLKRLESLEVKAAPKAKPAGKKAGA
jgi:polyhydroxyalkanoate synthesis regulator phasin